MTRLFIVLSLLAFTNISFAAGNVPDNTKDNTHSEIKLRYLHTVNSYTLMGEVQISDQSEGRTYQSALLGSYYRFNDNLRAGLFYQRQYGFQHDADWFKDPVTLIWQWRNTNKRGEDLALFDLSPKISLADNLTFEFKTRFEHNFFNTHNSVRLRPSLNYFVLGDELPIASFFLQLEQLLALNYGTHSISERWEYLGGLYHFSASVQAGGFVARRWQEWSSTPEYTAITGKTYAVEADSIVIGITFIVKN